MIEYMSDSEELKSRLHEALIKQITTPITSDEWNVHYIEMPLDKEAGIYGCAVGLDGQAYGVKYKRGLNDIEILDFTLLDNYKI